MMIDLTAFKARENSYRLICENNTGEILGAEKWEEIKGRRAVRRQQTEEIASRLESVGVDCRDLSGESLFRVAVASGVAEEIPLWRHINFLPEVGARNRERFLAPLTHWLGKSANRHTRYFVCSGGPRVLISEQRACFQRVHRRLSDMNAEPWFKGLGLKMVWRSSEVGDLRRGRRFPVRQRVYMDSGGLRHEHEFTSGVTVNCHANVLIKCSRALGGEEWAAVLQRMERYMGARVQDNREIIEARECVKYVMKPEDVLALSAEELKAMFWSLFRLHMVQPMGELRDYLNGLRERQMKVSRWRKTDNSSELKEMPDWNSRCRANDDLEVLERIYDPETTEEEENRPEDEKGELQVDAVVARCAPCPVLTPISEPSILVRNLRRVDVVLSHPWAKRAMEYSRERYEYARVEAQRVHSADYRPSVVQAENPSGLDKTTVTARSGEQRERDQAEFDWLASKGHEKAEDKQRSPPAPSGFFWSSAMKWADLEAVNENRRSGMAEDGFSRLSEGEDMDRFDTLHARSDATFGNDFRHFCRN